MKLTKYLVSIILLVTIPTISIAQMAVYDAAVQSTLLSSLPGQLAALQAEVAQLKGYNWNSSDAYNQMQNHTKKLFLLL